MPKSGIVCPDLHLSTCPRCGVSWALQILRTRVSKRFGYRVHIACCSACRRLCRVPEIPRGALK